MPSAGHSAAPTGFAYLGPEGTFAEAALAHLTRSLGAVDRSAQPQPSVGAALAAVRSGACRAALVPMENSVEGSVPATMDGLVDGDPLVVTREVFLPVGFVLAVRPGVGLDGVGSVASHPHALAQTRGWLAEHLPAADVLAAASTADAARLDAPAADISTLTDLLAQANAKPAPPAAQPRAAGVGVLLRPSTAPARTALLGSASAVLVPPRPRRSG